MIEKVKIIENKNTPLSYLPDVECFGNGVEFNFKNGVNVTSYACARKITATVCNNAVPSIFNVAPSGSTKLEIL